jgi:trehalose 6-phosphate synthase/phosphatase
LQVNPYDVDGSAEVYYRALVMPREERRIRLAPLRARVQMFDVHRWVGSFLESLAEVTPSAARQGPTIGGAAAERALVRRMAETESLLLLLDYDGTLVPFTPTPELARPDREILALLRALAARPDTEVHLVSGRPQETLQEWFGDLPIWLHAEHGFLSRDPETRQWVAVAELGGSWREPVLAMLREITQRTPGSLVEVKAAALAWHYRMADQETGARRANELRLHLNQLLSNQPVEILAGNRVIEIRPYGVHKGRIVPPLSAERQAATAILAIGDDRTDEDLFNALPAEAVTIRVGPGVTRARFRLDNVAAVRRLLQSLREVGIAALPEQR